MRMRSLLKVYDVAQHPYKTNGEHYGHATLLMGMCPTLSQLTLRQSLWYLGGAFAHKQFKFYFDAKGMPVGFVSWATLSADVEDRFLSEDRPNLHLSEWNEGDSLWIIDFVAPFGNLKYILRDLRDVVFSGHDTVRYVRRKKNAVTVKEMSRETRSFFFSKS